MTNISFYQKSKKFLLDILHNNKLGVVASSFLMLLSQFINFGSRFVSGVILARALQPAGRGQYAILVLIPTCTQMLGSLSLSIPIGFYSAKDPSTAPAINANNMFTALFLTVIYSSILFLLYHFQLLGSFSDLLQPDYMILMCGALFFLISVNYSQSLFLGTNYISAKNVLYIMEPIVFICLIIVIAMLGHLNLWWAFSAWVATRAVGFIASIILLLRLKLFSLKPDLKLFIQSIKMGTKGILAEISGFIILQSDIFMLRYFLDDQATGLYSVAASLSFVIMAIPQTIGLALFPNISKLEQREGIDGTDKTIITCRITIIITMLVSIIAMILAPLLIKKIYGESFSDVVYPFLILTVAVSVIGFTHVLMAQLHARGVIHITALCSLSAAIMNIALNIFLIPKYSFIGAAFSSLISYAFFGIILSYFYLKMVKKPVSILIPRGEDFKVLYQYFCSSVEKLKAKF